MTLLVHKSNLCHEQLSCIRLVSNLVFVLSCIEKVVTSRLNNYVQRENVNEIPFCLQRGNSVNIVHVNNYVQRENVNEIPFCLQIRQ